MKKSSQPWFCCSCFPALARSVKEVEEEEEKEEKKKREEEEEDMGIMPCCSSLCFRVFSKACCRLENPCVHCCCGCCCGGFVSRERLAVAERRGRECCVTSLRRGAGLVLGAL